MEASNKRNLAANIQIVHSPGGAGPEIDALAAALQSVSPEVSVREEEPGLYNAWEWLLPAAVMIYISKGFLDGFLKELGAGAAKSLKAALVNAFRGSKSSGGKWSTVEEMRDYLKKVEAAAESGETANSIDRCGKPVVPLRISVALPYGVEARFVLPADLDDSQVFQALGELESVLPIAFARDQRRDALLAIQHKDPDKAMRLALSDSRGGAVMYREATYVFNGNESNWIDADEALQKQVRQQLEARAEQDHPKTKSTVRAQRQKRKKKK